MIRLQLSVLFAGAVLLSGCATVGYYSQSVGGHLRVWAKRQDIEMLLQSEKTSDRLKQRLKLVSEIRRFASRELKLPKNYSFRSYVDIRRDSIVYNVVAAPEFSVEPKKWCFPVLGCLAYKGYFNRRRAVAEALKLKRQGYDVAVEGVTAYSTLGWFSDPVLNTFIGRSEDQLAGLIFHELTHQVIYIKNDTTFNESLATAVELTGIERWVRHRRRAPGLAKAYAANKRYEQAFIRFALGYRRRLKQLYARAIPDSEKRRQKKKILAQMQQAYRQLKKGWGGYSGFDAWMAQGVNNARLSTLATYYTHVRSFLNLLAQHQGDMRAFYRAVKRIGALPKEQRDRVLSRLRQNKKVSY